MLRRLVALMVVAAFVVSGCGRSTEGKFGAELYEISCAGCHGADGRGSVIGPDIASAESRTALELSDGQVAGAIRVGPGSMPGNPLLTEQQLDSLVEYLRGLHDDG